MFALASTIDLDLFLLINQQWRLGLFDFIMPILSSMSVLLAILGISLICAVKKNGKRQIIFFLILFAGMGLTDFTTNLIKKQVQRVRPLNAIAETYYQESSEWQTRPTDFVQTKEYGRSFPSAHSSNSMCLAILAILLWPALKKWPLFLPLLVGYSRIYLGKHYPTDVLGGWLWGLIVAGIVWMIWTRFGKRYMPQNED